MSVTVKFLVFYILFNVEYFIYFSIESYIFILVNLRGREGGREGGRFQSKNSIEF
jgi:hypothetical protein